ncbi:GNAT family N-acetyltransferase [Streptomyces sp. SID3212]|uniref:GNAT family N-acetyltransferase n=1 Tax=Streptomyces sp. SID3212 TaxID=2690259 RepID=UPI00136A2E66|nr:GNAT family N-acetyltransferase [Streptomyces sp. SID3212]MYV54314.1 GNAT family N-acetyltransferase [Streptomyces sp. SID3212]
MATPPKTRTTPASPTTRTTAQAPATPARVTPSTTVSSPLAGSVSRSVFTTELVRDADGFAALAPAWNDLHRRSRTATPFQSHAWLHSWWLSYGTPGRLRVVLVRRGGVLVAAAPLMLIHRPFPVLIQLGGSISDFSDVLLDDSCADAAAAALAKALARAARTAVIDLREVRPGAAAERVHACWPGTRRQLADSPCLELPAVPMDELLGRLASARAQRARAKLRKLDALGIEERVVPQDEIPGAVERLLELHRLQWQGRGVTPEHLSTRFAAHLTRSVASMVEQGDAMITEFRLAGELVASDLTLMSSQLAGGYLYGADPVLRAKKVDVAMMLLRTCARQISASGRTTLSMLRGNEPYKHHWRPDTVCNQRFLLARTYLTPWLHLLAARAAGRGRAAALVKRLRRGGDKA